MKNFRELASKETIEKTIAALKANGIDAFFVETGEEAKEKVFELIPEGAEVLNNSSQTLEILGIADEIVNSGKFNSVKKKLMSMDPKTDGKEMKKLGSAPEYTIGSVHAVTEDGKVLIASASGSQIPGYAYGSDHIIWVIGTQKIVKDLDEGIKRIYEHSLPLENERAKKAYGMESAVLKILIVNMERKPGRITAIFVNKVLGF